MENSQLKCIIESALLCYGSPLSLKRLAQMFDETENVNSAQISSVIRLLTQEYKDRGVELVEVASGFRFQTQAHVSAWMQKLGNERPPRYSRALLETLALIAYSQPITRPEIEAVRGVAVNTLTIKTLLERNWVQVVGHRDVPGKPALYATTKQFLDYFNLAQLADLLKMNDTTAPAIPGQDSELLEIKTAVD